MNLTGIFAVLLVGDSKSSMVAMQYIAKKIETYLRGNFCHTIFCDAVNARTFPSAKRQNTQVCCIAAIVHSVFHILFH
jgi:hypothetical protein